MLVGVMAEVSVSGSREDQIEPYIQKYSPNRLADARYAHMKIDAHGNKGVFAVKNNWLEHNI